MTKAARAQISATTKAPILPPEPTYAPIPIGVGHGVWAIALPASPS